jgi:hypothetical protein
MEHLYFIVDKDKNKILFKRNRAQKDFNERKTNRNVILKSRRIGFTTDEALDMLDDTLFTLNFNSLFTAHTQIDAEEIFDNKINFAWKNIDPIYKNMWEVDTSNANKLKFCFPGDNSFSTITVSNSGRSGLNNRVHVSEYAKLCAKYPSKGEEIISGTFPSVPPEGRIDIESTAEGMCGNFYEIFIEAYHRNRPTRDKEFTAFFYNWTWDDKEIAKIKIVIPVSEMEESQRFRDYQVLHSLTDIQITYYYGQWCALNKDWDKLHQEYPTTPEEAFVASGNTFFNKERITYLSTDTPKKIEVDKFKLPEKLLKYYIDGTLSIYETPQELGSYVIAGDVAEGKGQDSSACVCINNKTLKPAAEFDSNKIRPDEYAEFLNALGRYYNTAYLAVESNSGLWVLTELLETYQYPNLYWREAIDDVSHTVNKRLGFSTSGLSRKPMLDNLLVQVNLYEGIWTSKFLQECLVFVKNDMGRPEAMEGKHDDMVIAYGICHYCRDNAVSEHQAPETGELKSSQERIMARLNKLKGDTNEISQDFYI